MIDRLEELLLSTREEQDEPLWWTARPRRLVPGQQQEQERMSPGEAQDAAQAAQTMQAVQQSHRNAARETVSEVPERAWTVQALERAHRTARRAARGGAGREPFRASEHGMAPGVGQRAAAALKDSPAGGRQGLTAQIDAQFRRDARRYDGRLGLL